MIKRLSLLVVLVTVCGLLGVVRADGDAKTLKGTLAGAKCVLKEAGCTECQSVLQVKDGDKTVNYYLVMNETAKKCHPKCCTKAVEGVSVTGTVTEKDGKMWIDATKVEFPEMKKEE